MKNIPCPQCTSCNFSSSGTLMRSVYGHLFGTGIKMFSLITDYHSISDSLRHSYILSHPSE